MRTLRCVPIGILTILLTSAWSLCAQDVEHPLEPPNTSSPRAALYSFIETVNEAYTLALERGRTNITADQRVAMSTKISRHLYTEHIPEHIHFKVSTEAAICLKEILDRVPIPAPEEIPGGDDETLPDKWRIPHTDLTLVRMTEGELKGEYLFSEKTVDKSGDYYRQISIYLYRTEGPPVSRGLYEWFTTEPGSAWLAWIVNRLPTVFRTKWGAHTIWQWVGVAILLVLGAAAMMLAYRLGRTRARKFKGAHTLRYLVTLMFPLTAVLVPLSMKHIIRVDMILTGHLIRVLDFLLGLVLLFAIMTAIWALGNRLTTIVVTLPRLRPKGLDAQFVRLAFRILTMVTVVIVFLEGGQRLGIPLSTLLAGAGISGFAIAMAAQDSLKNILGSMMITLDKPFVIGERIKVKGMDGVVEEIGLRSTRLQLLNGHVAAIPNEDLARVQIENIGRRPFIRRATDLRLPLNTPQDKLEQGVAAVRNILENHEGMHPDFPPRVSFDEFDPDGFNIKVFYWYHPPEYWDFLAHSEQVNLAICRAFEDIGLPFRLPARITPTDLEGTQPFNFPGGKDPAASTPSD